jgi:hypothetical protein
MNQGIADTDNRTSGGPSSKSSTSVVSFSSTSMTCSDPSCVTGNESEATCGWALSPTTLTTEQLQDAHWLGLSGVSVSPGAVALVADLVARIAAYEAASGARKTARRQTGEAKLRQAVGALVAGLLRRWGRSEPQAVFRSRKVADFTGSPVAARQHLVACDGLVALGLVHLSRSIRYGTGVVWDVGGPEAFRGKAARLWPAQALLDVAAVHGVT